MFIRSEAGASPHAHTGGKGAGIIMTSTLNSAPRALIADDQADVLEALRLLLKGEGYQIETAASPAAVLESLRQRNCDLLLMDLNYARDTTSGQEGMNLLASVRAFDSTLPVIVMTAWASIDLAVEAMQKGSADFIQKPWENSRLLSIMRNQVANGRAIRRAKQLDHARDEIGLKAGSASDLSSGLRIACSEIERVLQCERAMIFIKGTSDRAFIAISQTAKDGVGLGAVDAKAVAVALAGQVGSTAVREAGFSTGDLSKLLAAGIDTVVPISDGRQPIGLLALGIPRSGSHYGAEEESFLADIAERLAAAIGKWQMRQQELELKDAREIQVGLLPKEIPQVAGCQISAAWQPSRAVSGDYFDVFNIETGETAICIADVAGKGTAAALLMSNLQAVLKSLAPKTSSPAELCSKVNRLLWGNIVPGRFITCFYGMLRPASMEFIYTNAGHNPPIVIRQDGSHFRLSEGGAVLAGFEDWEYLQGETRLAPGDRVVLFTDGITESLSRNGDEFTEPRLIELAIQNRRLDAHRLQEKIMSTVAEFTDGELQDDATVIVMAIEP
jgi:serine phosphatase RsbU (regulator of sigma subunit)/FixJ family two-component response regulator